MTVAEETRAAVRERPFLYDALAAGVANYAAAAATLELDADPDAVATALRRFADELDDEGGRMTTTSADVRITMHRGLGRLDANSDADGLDSDAGEPDGDDGKSDDIGGAPGRSERDEPLLVVAGTEYVVDAGEATAVLARGPLDAPILERVLGRLRTAGVEVEAAGATPKALLVVVGRRDGAAALRAVEAVLDD